MIDYTVTTVTKDGRANNTSIRAKHVLSAAYRARKDVAQDLELPAREVRVVAVAGGEELVPADNSVPDTPADVGNSHLVSVG